MSAGVVGERAEARALERARAVDHVAPGRGEAVQERDRVALPRALAAQRGAVALDLEGDRVVAQRDLGGVAGERQGAGEVLDVLVAQPEQRDVAVADRALGVDDEDRAAHEATRARRRRRRARWRGRGRRAGHGEPVLGDEALVRVDRLGRDPQHLGVEIVEVVGGIAVGAELARAHRREVARVKGEDHPAAAEGGQPDASLPRSPRARSLVRDRRSRFSTSAASVAARSGARS